MTKELGLQHIVEMPSHGAKAAGSLYSIGFALAGCNVTLVNPELKMMAGWNKLDLREKIQSVSGMDVYQTEFTDNQFDLAFNFVTWTELADPLRYLMDDSFGQMGHDVSKRGIQAADESFVLCTEEEKGENLGTSYG